MNQIQMAAKLYECRDTCKKLWGNEWKEKVSFHTTLIKVEMINFKIDNEIEVAIKLVKDNGNMDGAGMFAMKCFAAAVEMIDPSL